MTGEQWAFTKDAGRRNRYRIAFVSEHGLTDSQAFSGIPYAMHREVNRQAIVEQYIHAPLADVSTLLSEPALGLAELRECGREVQSALKSTELDFVLCQGTSCVPFLELPCPIVVWHDSTWQTLLQLPSAEFRATAPALHEWDRRVLDRASLVAYASRWVRDATVQQYGGARASLAEVPFGPSIDIPSADEVEQAWERRCAAQTLRLLFVGTDWRRKGLRAAHSLLVRLGLQGIRAQLDVVGPSTGPGADFSPRMWDSARPLVDDELFALRLRCDKRVGLQGRLNRAQPHEGRRLRELLLDSHYLVHPASFECYGVSLVEANAFGVPVIALDRFGPRSIIVPPRNGIRLSEDGFLDGASNYISEGLGGEVYMQRAHAARRECLSRLTWSKAVEQLLTAVGTRLMLG